MVIDTSAILAILLAEEDAATYAGAIEKAEACRMSAGTYLEAGIVLDSRDKPFASRGLDSLIQQAEITIEPFTPHQALLAREAYRDFGKGRHPAALNLGDCFAYALSRDQREPLLFKGTDFAQTDVESALP